MKRSLRLAAKISGTIGIVGAMYLVLLVHPEPLFPCSVTHSGITFFSQSPLPPQVAEIASEVTSRVSSSELYDSAFNQRVFVVERPWLWRLLNGPYQSAMARNVELGNAVLVPALDVIQKRVQHFDGRSAGAVGILTHEAVHTLVQRRIGLSRLWRLQWWQREGYPEYIASGGAIESEAPPRYQEAARAWKYLLETRQRSFDQVLQLQSLTVPAP